MVARRECGLKGKRARAFLMRLESDKNYSKEARLGGSVSEAADFGSGHDLMVREFEPRVELCADSSEPGDASDSLCLPLSAPSLLALCLSLCQK